MKKVIITSSIIAVLMGCSFSKKDAKFQPESSTKEKAAIAGLQSAIKLLNEQELTAFLNNTESSKLNMPFSNGQTSVEVAIQRGNVSILNLLLSHGASPLVANSVTGFSPYQTALKNEIRNQLDLSMKLAMDSSIRKMNQNLVRLLSQNDYSTFLDSYSQKNISCSTALVALIERKKSFLQTTIPDQIVEKVLTTGNCAKNPTLLNMEDAVKNELKAQIRSRFRNMTILKFLSKNASSPITFIVELQHGKSYHFSTASILVWASIKNNLQLDKEVSQLKELFPTPGNSAALVSYRDSKIDLAEHSISFDEIKSMDTDFIEAIEVLYSEFEESFQYTIEGEAAE
ncbi:hypothetical protein ACLWBD_14895 [Bdellovibrio sp. HCB117]|uniref:hypothetical protein n=1 Tax=Bdellovibrio sp. HCB117 TaxID=3394359 RepID=UPI0039B696F3